MSKAPWRALADRLRGRSDTIEHGVGTGHSSRPRHVYNQYNITDRQQEILEVYAEYGLRWSARVLDISRQLVVNTLHRIAIRWDMEDASYAELVDRFRAMQDEQS
jgi:DNA-binding CsgD family transcriptional regulator